MAEAQSLNVFGMTQFAPSSVMKRGAQGGVQPQAPMDDPRDSVEIGKSPTMVENNSPHAGEFDSLLDSTVYGRQIGEYTLKSRLGYGGMASVYLADGPDGQPVALKVLNHDVLKERTERVFLEEAGALQWARGLPNVLQYLGSGYDGKFHYIATQYLPDSVELDDLTRLKGPLDLPQAMSIYGDAAKGLAGLHSRGLAHRDFKGLNVLVTPQGSMVIDLGLAKLMTETVNEEGIIHGTPRYMSPEQSRNEPLTPASDLYSVGLDLFESMTGRGALGEPSSDFAFLKYRALDPNFDFASLPLKLRYWVMPELLAQEPEHRLQDANLLADDLAYVAQDEARKFEAFTRAIDSGRTAAVVTEAPTAGTLIYFPSRSLSPLLEERINETFKPEDGYDVFRSDRANMRGMFVYSRATEAEVLANKADFFKEARLSFDAPHVALEIAADSQQASVSFFDSDSRLVKSGATQADSAFFSAIDSKEAPTPSRPGALNKKPRIPTAILPDQATASLKPAREAALSRIDGLPITAAEKAEAKKIASAAWDREQAEFADKLKAKEAFERSLEADYAKARELQADIKAAKAALKKTAMPEIQSGIRADLSRMNEELSALKQSLGARTSGFIRQQGSMMAVIVALDIAMHYDEIKKEGMGYAVKREMGVLAGACALVAGQLALERALGTTAGFTSARIGGGLAVGLAAYSSMMEHEAHLRSSDAATQAYAKLAVATEGLVAYISASAGLAAAKAAAPGGLLASTVAGVGAGTLTYVFMGTAGKALGTDKWIARKWTRGDIINAFHDLGARRDGAGVLAVKDQDTEIPYFSQIVRQVEVNGKTVGLTHAQEVLGILQAARNYDNLSIEERRAVADQPGNRALSKMLGALGSLDRLEVANYAALDEELLEAVADSIARYRAKHHVQDDTSGSRSRFEVVCGNRRREPVTNPLTGEVVGSRTYVDIKVFGERQHLGMGANGTGWISDGEQTVNSYAISGPIKTEGDGQKIEAAEAIRATASKAHPGTYDISLTELAALDLAIPADKLALLPTVRRDLAKQLSLLGYKADGDPAKAYLKYAMQSLDLTQLGPLGVSLNLSASKTAVDPFQINLETGVLRRLTAELIVK